AGERSAGRPAALEERRRSKREPPRGFVGPRVTEPETECQGGESRFRAGFPGLSGLAGRPRPGPPGQPAPGRARLAPPRTSSSAASMFETLSERLNGALQRVTGRGRITEDNVRDTVRQIRMALLEADVALPVVKRIVERVRQRALGAEVARSLNPGQTFVKIVHDELVIVLGRDQTPLRAKGRPAVLLLVGLQGAGKTTTAGKLARFLSDGSPSEVLLVSTDVYRPAAREQLETIARDLGAGYVRPEGDPRSIAAAALDEARRRGSRWLIVDTAGRLHVDDEMM